jgi:3',5'-cyclic AMP phosphodiesterase CpdA
MIRIIFTADIHLGITSLPRVMQLVNEIETGKPDLVAIAGDIGEGIENFELVLEEFRRLGVPVGVVAGNHDVWNHDKNTPSKLMYEKLLPKAAKSTGTTWLETENLIVGGVALVGSIAWYDYSAQDPAQKTTSDECWKLKGKHNADAWMVDWEWNDFEFCKIIQPDFEERLKSAQDDETVREIVILTHSPIFDAGIARKPNNPDWAFSNAYYGNLTFGEIASKFSKVTHSIAGHTHAGRDAIVEVDNRKVRVVTLNSKYEGPVYITIELRSQVSH